MSMRKTVFALTGALALSATALMASPAQAVPASLSKSLNTAAGVIDLVEQARYYRGRRYCFYVDAWRGPGWYICGYSSRYGYGWGGPNGWLGWHFGPVYRGPVYRGPVYRGPVYRGPAYGHPGPRHNRQHQRRQRQPIGDY